MLVKKRLSFLLSIFTAIVILAASNHCVLEDLFTSDSVTVVALGELQPQSDGGCGAAKHGSDEQHGPLESCQAHTLVTVKNERSDFDPAKIFSAPPLLEIAVLLSQDLNRGEVYESGSAPQINVRSSFVKSQIVTLISAPQAPPYTA